MSIVTVDKTPDHWSRSSRIPQGHQASQRNTSLHPFHPTILHELTPIFHLITTVITAITAIMIIMIMMATITIYRAL